MVAYKNVPHKFTQNTISWPFLLMASFLLLLLKLLFSPFSQLALYMGVFLGVLVVPTGLTRLLLPSLQQGLATMGNMPPVRHLHLFALAGFYAFWVIKLSLVWAGVLWWMHLPVFYLLFHPFLGALRLRYLQGFSWHQVFDGGYWSQGNPLQRRLGNLFWLFQLSLKTIGPLLFGTSCLLVLVQISWANVLWTAAGWGACYLLPDWDHGLLFMDPTPPGGGGLPGNFWGGPSPFPGPVGDFIPPILPPDFGPEGEGRSGGGPLRSTPQSTPSRYTPLGQKISPLRSPHDPPLLGESQPGSPLEQHLVIGEGNSPLTRPLSLPWGIIPELDLRLTPPFGEVEGSPKPATPPSVEMPSVERRTPTPGPDTSGQGVQLISIETQTQKGDVPADFSELKNSIKYVLNAVEKAEKLEGVTNSMIAKARKAAHSPNLDLYNRLSDKEKEVYTHYLAKKEVQAQKDRLLSLRNAISLHYKLMPKPELVPSVALLPASAPISTIQSVPRQPVPGWTPEGVLPGRSSVAPGLGQPFPMVAPTPTAQAPDSTTLAQYLRDHSVYLHQQAAAEAELRRRQAWSQPPVPMATTIAERLLQETLHHQPGRPSVAPGYGQPLYVLRTPVSQPAILPGLQPSYPGMGSIVVAQSHQPVPQAGHPSGVPAEQQVLPHESWTRVKPKRKK